MADTWLKKLRSAQKTCMVQDGRRKIHYTFLDGSEMAEEYDNTSGNILVRKWKKKQTGGFATRASQESWEYELGEPQKTINIDMEGMTESSNNPIFVRKDEKTAFQWRIRNLPYPIQTYMVTVDDDQQFIIIRTSNKKYYKKFDIPDMNRAGQTLCQDNITIAHANNTLIVTYKKPKELLVFDKIVKEELQKLKAGKDGDVDCTPS